VVTSKKYSTVKEGKRERMGRGRTRKKHTFRGGEGERMRPLKNNCLIPARSRSGEKK